MHLQSCRLRPRPQRAAAACAVTVRHAASLQNPLPPRCHVQGCTLRTPGTGMRLACITCRTSILAPPSHRRGLARTAAWQRAAAGRSSRCAWAVARRGVWSLNLCELRSTERSGAACALLPRSPIPHMHACVPSKVRTKPLVLCRDYEISPEVQRLFPEEQADQPWCSGSRVPWSPG